MEKVSGAAARENEERIVRVEVLISWALRAGVYGCGLVIAVGLLSRLLGIGAVEQHGTQSLIRELLGGGELAGFHAVASPGALLGGVARWQPDALINGGLLLLIALPILRVALTTLIFLRERDWAFVLITLLVLCVLLSGIFLGKAL